MNDWFWRCYISGNLTKSIIQFNFITTELQIPHILAIIRYYHENMILAIIRRRYKFLVLYRQTSWCFKVVLPGLSSEQLRWLINLVIPKKVFFHGLIIFLTAFVHMYSKTFLGFCCGNFLCFCILEWSLWTLVWYRDIRLWFQNYILHAQELLVVIK